MERNEILKAYETISDCAINAYTDSHELVSKSALMYGYKNRPEAKFFLTMIKIWISDKDRRVYQGHRPALQNKSKFSVRNFFENMEVLKRNGLSPDVYVGWGATYSLVGWFYHDASLVIEETNHPTERIRDVFNSSLAIKNLVRELCSGIDKLAQHVIIENKPLSEFKHELSLNLIGDTINTLIKHNLLKVRDMKYYENLYGKSLVNAIRTVFSPEIE